MGAPDGTITYANQGFLDYIGLTIEDIGGEGWLRALSPGRSPARLHLSWSHSISTASTSTRSTHDSRRDGHVRWWWVRAQPVRDEHGNILHWLGVNIDIDDRRPSPRPPAAPGGDRAPARRTRDHLRDRASRPRALRSRRVRYLRVNGRQAETIGLPKTRSSARPITEIARPLKGLHELFQQSQPATPSGITSSKASSVSSRRAPHLERQLLSHLQRNRKVEAIAA